MKLKILSLRASTLAVLSLLLGASVLFMHGGKAGAVDLPVVYVSGTLSADQTWSSANAYFIIGTLTIPDGKTLTIPAGTVVKTNYHSTGIQVNSGGTLDINGTTMNRVIFTSYRDDSAGGDTNGDGASNGQDFDYTGISSNGGTVELASVDFRYTASVLSQDCIYNVGTATVTDSVIGGSVGLSRCDQGQTTIQRNQFSMLSGSGNPALSLHNSIPLGVSLTGINKNTFTGSSGRAINFSASSDYTPLVPANETWDFSSADGAILMLYSGVINGTLNVAAGSIIKVQHHGDGLKVNSTGILNLNGTTTNPTRITSYRNDTIAGDTNGDGTSTPTNQDYNHGIRNEGGILAGEFVYFTNGGGNISINCNYSANQSQFEDSTFTGGVAFSNCDSGKVSLKRNQFALPGDSGAYAISSYNAPPVGVILSGSDKNILIGSGYGKVMDISTSSDYTPLVPANESWTVDSASGAVLRIRTSKVDGTLQLNSGSIVKVSSQGEGFIVAEGGQLQVAGTNLAPVAITSYKNDSLGGDSNGDGNTSPGFSDFNRAMTVQAGGEVNTDYLAISYVGQGIVANGGESDFQHTNVSAGSVGLSGIAGKVKFSDSSISDAQYGLDVTSGDIVYRGTFANISGRYIRSCNWGGNCSVDAAYLDWGSASGPFIASGTDKACGTVTVSPWKVSGSFTGVSAPFDIKNCDNSPTPVDLFVSALTAHQQAVAQRRIDCDNGFQDACNLINTTFGCLGSAIQLAASQSPIPVSYTNPTELVDTVGTTTANAAKAAIDAVEVEHPPTFSLAVATAALNVVGLYSSLADAYDSCH